MTRYVHRILSMALTPFFGFAHIQQHRTRVVGLFGTVQRHRAGPALGGIHQLVCAVAPKAIDNSLKRCASFRLRLLDSDMA